MLTKAGLIKAWLKKLAAKLRRHFTLRGIVEAIASKQQYLNQKQLEQVSLMINAAMFELDCESGRYKGRPIISTCQESLASLIQSRNSLIRFGDGEYFLMFCETGGPGYEKSSAKLRGKLIEAFKSNDEKLDIGLNALIYTRKDSLALDSSVYWRAIHNKTVVIIQNLKECLVPGKVYLNASLTCWLPQNAEDYFSDMKKLWVGDDVTVFCGETTLKGLAYNIFYESDAHSVSYMYGPATCAFGQYDSLLEKALTIPKDHTVVMILGPAGKCLAHELFKRGYRVLDLGHFAKLYDWFKKGKPVDTSFWAD